MATVRFGFHDLYFLSLRVRIAIGLAAIALVGAALWIAAQFLHPIPPRHVVLATGPEGSALHRFGEQYREILARDGIRIDLRVTQGAGENLQLLEARQSGVDAAFVIAGTTAERSGLVNLSNLFYAPLWPLVRGEPPPSTIAALKGKRIAVGLPESGVSMALAPLLAANGITAENTQLMHLADDEALRRFVSGSVDAVISPDGPVSPAFRQAVLQPGIAIMSLSQAAAYARRYPWITPLQLPQGTFDLVRDVPPRDTTLVAGTAMLVARDDLHPTVVDLFVDAARSVHGAAGYFERRGEFPNLVQIDAIPVSAQAVNYARTGPSFLRRYLPMWLADFVQRMLTLAIPIGAAAYPLFQWLPTQLNNLFQGRIDRCYAELRRLEAEIEAAARPRDAIASDLDALVLRVRRLQLPVAYTNALFTLRIHIGLVRQRVG